ncbi:hypothetical protein NDU88_006430 [Pleurodeles waltl]|uniref:Uncharacterized protein n=1 Tax=Pleurodeles waltl TaxID=8319 RepID=A0AAV7MCY6_PLEWA|nr:hypothetical protein NDU88_006430 [Pleurodeles waltl]
MPRLDAVTLGLSGTLRNPRRRGETRPGSPASPLRLPSRRFGPRPSTRPRLRPRSQASRPRAQQLAGFTPPALSVVAGRVRALLATPSGPVPPLGPRQARRGHDFKHFLAGPSGARSSGVRHLRVLGHAPYNIHLTPLVPI